MCQRNFTTKKKVVFASMPKDNFYLREFIIKFILEQGHTPLCAFMMFSYFLLNAAGKEDLIEANNDLIRRSDELWVFGPFLSQSQGVISEIKLARQLGLPVRYFCHYAAGKDNANFIQFEEMLVSLLAE